MIIFSFYFQPTLMTSHVKQAIFYVELHTSNWIEKKKIQLDFSYAFFLSDLFFGYV